MKLTKSLCRKLMRKQLGTRGIPRIQWAAASDHNPLGKKSRKAIARLGDNLVVYFSKRICCDENGEWFETDEIWMVIVPVDSTWMHIFPGNNNALSLLFDANSLELLPRSTESD